MTANISGPGRTVLIGSQRVVFVHGYVRIRFGKREWVTAHHRSLPR